MKPQGAPARDQRVPLGLDRAAREILEESAWRILVEFAPHRATGGLQRPSPIRSQDAAWLADMYRRLEDDLRSEVIRPGVALQDPLPYESASPSQVAVEEPTWPKPDDPVTGAEVIALMSTLEGWRRSYPPELVALVEEKDRNAPPIPEEAARAVRDAATRQIRDSRRRAWSTWHELRNTGVPPAEAQRLALAAAAGDREHVTRRSTPR